LINVFHSRTIIPNEKVINEIERRFGDAIKEEFGIDPKALMATKAGYSMVSEMLTPSEIEQLRQEKKVEHAFFQKAFAYLKREK
jgi:hypothetical protein